MSKRIATFDLSEFLDSARQKTPICGNPSSPRLTRGQSRGDREGIFFAYRDNSR